METRLVYENGRIFKANKQDWSKVLFLNTQKLTKAIENTINFFKVLEEEPPVDDTKPFLANSNVNYLLNENDSEEFAKKFDSALRYERLAEYVSFTENEDVCSNHVYVRARRFIVSQMQALFENLEEMFSQSVLHTYAVAAINSLNGKDFKNFIKETETREAILDLYSKKKAIVETQLDYCDDGYSDYCTGYNVKVVNNAHETVIFLHEQYHNGNEVRPVHVIFFNDFIVSQPSDFAKVLNTLIYLYKTKRSEKFLHILLNIIMSFKEDFKRDGDFDVDVSDNARQCALSLILLNLISH